MSGCGYKLEFGTYYLKLVPLTIGAHPGVGIGQLSRVLIKKSTQTFPPALFTQYCLLLSEASMATFSWNN